MQFCLLPGVLFGVLAGVLWLRDLLLVFMGVLPEKLLVDPLSTDSLHVLLALSLCCLRCQRIWGPLVSGASILNKLLMSFSKFRWDMLCS